jgi:hypothetical protein
MSNEVSQIGFLLTILNDDKALKVSRLKEYFKKTSLRLISKSVEASDYETALQLTYNFKDVIDDKYRRNQYEKRLSSESLLSLEVTIRQLYIKQLKEKELNLIEILETSFPNDLTELRDSVLAAISNYFVDNKEFKGLYNSVKLRNSMEPFTNSALITRLMRECMEIKEKLRYADFITKRMAEFKTEEAA